MKFLDLTLADPAANLALDEALLLTADGASIQRPDSKDFATGDGSQVETAFCLNCEVLRIWRAGEPFVVLGRSSHFRSEVNYDVAFREGIPIFRRFSGGATVVVAPGCLLYSLLLRLDSGPGLRMLDKAHHHVISRLLKAVHRFVPSAEFQGTCDLSYGGRKFSGNSLRVGRNWMLYHGTVLLDMDLSLIDQLLKHPPREPEYRQGRTHKDFVANLGIDGKSLVQALREVWQADQELKEPESTGIPPWLVPQLVREKYGNDSWNLQR